ncbi:MAG: phosphoribosyltransferase family protein [Polyangiales bacterium]
MSTRIFRDRVDAGRKLASTLLRFKDESPIVLGLPRGGVPVAREVSRALGAQLDVWVVRKLGAPYHEELGMGAVAEGDEVYIDPDIVSTVGATSEQVQRIVVHKLAEVKQRCDRFRHGRPPPSVAGRTVILVDDGVATGGTARAALRAIRRQNPKRVVLAVPVGATETLRSLGEEADEVICLEPREDFYAVGLWYRDFSAVEDEEVVSILAEEAKRKPSARPAPRGFQQRAVSIQIGRGTLEGDLTVPEGAHGLVIFAHGSGSSRKSPRNRLVAAALQHACVGTLLFDLLTAREEEADAYDGHLRFDIELLAKRLVAVTEWVTRQPDLRALAIGYFGASTGAAAALMASVERPDVQAIVSRGGRPDLAMRVLDRVTAPTLLIVGSYDTQVLEMNREALVQIVAPKKLEIVEGATHLFEEPGTLEQVAKLAADWFVTQLVAETKPAKEAPMEQDEGEEMVECIDCGATISPRADRAFAVSSDTYLCFDCAVRRGGVYEADQDRWTTAPDVSDEPESVRREFSGPPRPRHPRL